LFVCSCGADDDESAVAVPARRKTAPPNFGRTYQMSRQTRRLRTSAALVLAVAAGSLPLGGCDQESATSEGAAVYLATAQTTSFDISTLASGELAARDRVELRSSVERQTAIVEIVSEGSRVAAGDVLVRLNSDEIKREIEEEELRLAEAQLNYEAAETAYDIQVGDNASSLRKAELKVELAELTMQQWENGDNIKQLKQLNTAIEKAARDLDRLKEKKIKSDDLYKKNYISYDEWKRDEISLLEAEAAHETGLLDKQAYEAYQVKRDHKQRASDLEEAKQELLRVKKSNEINLKNRASTRQNRAVQVSRREERLVEWKEQFEACTIVAPTGGLVVYGSTAQSDNWRWQNEGPIALGRQIRNNDLLIALPDTSEMIASVKVHESIAGRVRPGQRAHIKIEALGELVIPGEVESIGLLAESGGWRDPNRREYTVRVRIEPGEYSDELKPSMRCQAELVLGTVEDSISIPVQSVFSDGPVRYVLVPEGNRFARRPVNLGRRSDMHAQILAGLSVDEQVLIRDPKPGEEIEEPWDESLLVDAGYSLDEEGNPVAPKSANGRRRGPGSGGTKPQIAKKGGLKPASETADAGTESKATEVEKKPEEAAKPESTAETASKAEPTKTDPAPAPHGES